MIAFEVNQNKIAAVTAVRHTDLGIQPNFVPYLPAGKTIQAFCGLKEAKEWFDDHNNVGPFELSETQERWLKLAAMAFGLKIKLNNDHTIITDHDK